jgi:hypothetical protein
VAVERCPPAAPERWDVEWDEVRVERALPSLRADLLLLRAGAPVLALEVCATHAVDAEKAAKYRSLGLPWVEVSARRVAPDAGPGWSAGAPLPVLGDSRLHPAVRRCPRHEALYAAYEEHRRSGVHPLAWRVVHLYRTDAGRTAGLARTAALVVWMRERREEGEIVEAWLQRDGSDVPLSRPVEVRDRERAKRLLHRGFLRWARWTERERGAVVDSPMSWADGAPPPPRERAHLFPERLRMNPQSGTFEGVPGLPPLAWPLPLLETAEPHPVLGHAPLCWTELPTRDLGPLLHAVVGPCWLTLRPHEWALDGERRARADLSLHHHDGRRWSELRDAALSHSFSLPASAPSPAWAEILLAVARLAADNAAALASGRATLADIAGPALP